MATESDPSTEETGAGTSDGGGDDASKKRKREEDVGAGGERGNSSATESDLSKEETGAGTSDGGGGGGGGGGPFPTGSKLVWKLVVIRVQEARIPCPKRIT
ncbi:unnamed protein product [Linum trigynum]|uniref:Uncharacterized protein n=1 Tax=Linum trigynum TaxID=586398 RepID=A0AAV2C7Q1_9ROSI